MTVKMLSLPRAKQRILWQNLGLLQRMESQRVRQTPLVCTSELERLTLFWARKDGLWESWTRAHTPLIPAAGAPEDSAALNFSAQVAVAANNDLAALVYKRSFEDAPEPAVYIDILSWDAAGEAFREAQGGPFRLPLRGLGYEQAGFHLWAGFVKDELLLVLQLFKKEGAPRLALLSLPATELHRVAEPAAWKVTALDKGGYDFAVYPPGKELYIVHRRRAAAIRSDLSEAIPIGYFITEEGEGGQRIDEVYAPLVYLKVDLAAGAVIILSENIGYGEHPQIHAVKPHLITVDRPAVWAISGAPQENPPRLRIRPTNTEKLLLSDLAGTWQSKRLYHFSLERFPANLAAIQAVQYLAALDGMNLDLAAPLPLYPTALVRNQDRTTENKDHLLAFAHHDRQIGGLVVRFFSLQVVDQRDRPSELTIWNTGMALWDLNHGQMETDQLLDPENAQFGPEPFPGIEFATPAGLEIERTAVYNNTIGGALATWPQAPHTFFAYVDMGDGGGRVIFDPGAAPPEPTTPQDFKQINPAWFPEPENANLRWVQLPASNFTATDLPGYHAPYIELADLTNIDEPAYGSGIQPMFDFLERLHQFSVMGYAELGVTNPLEITPATAVDIQTALLSQFPALLTDQIQEPFRVRLRMTPNAPFADSPAAFSALFEGAPAAPTTFAWTISHVTNPTVPNFTADTREFSHTFTFPGQYDVTVTITDGNNQAVTLSQRINVETSLWRRLWDFHAQLQAPTFEIGSLAFVLSKYKIEFLVENGVRSQVTIHYLDQHVSEFRFLPGEGPVQGRIDYRLPVRLATRAVSLVGTLEWLAPWMQIDRLAIHFRLGRHYTPGVLASDRRPFDPVRRVPYATLGQADEETFDRLPGGLSTKPYGPVYLELLDPEVQVSLTPLARGSVWGLLEVLMAILTIPVLVTLVLAAAASAGLLGLLAGLVGLVGIALLAAVITLGFGALITELIAPPVLSAVAFGQVKAGLEESREDILAGMQAAGMLLYAGEGLAEAVAMQAIRQARQDGLDLPEPTKDGLNRARPHAFEMIVVGEGVARVLVRAQDEG